MAQITFKKTSIQTNGKLPSVGQAAPEFYLTNAQLEELSLIHFGKKKKDLKYLY